MGVIFVALDDCDQHAHNTDQRRHYFPITSQESAAKCLDFERHEWASIKLKK